MHPGAVAGVVAEELTAPRCDLGRRRRSVLALVGSAACPVRRPRVVRRAWCVDRTPGSIGCPRCAVSRPAHDHRGFGQRVGRRHGSQVVDRAGHRGVLGGVPGVTPRLPRPESRGVSRHRTCRVVAGPVVEGRGSSKAVSSKVALSKAASVEGRLEHRGSGGAARGVPDDRNQPDVRLGRGHGHQSPGRAPAAAEGRAQTKEAGAAIRPGRRAASRAPRARRRAGVGDGDGPSRCGGRRTRQWLRRRPTCSRPTARTDLRRSGANAVARRRGIPGARRAWRARDRRRVHPCRTRPASVGRSSQ